MEGEDKAKIKRILNAASSVHGGLTFNLLDVDSSAESIKTCAEVGKDLSEISDLVEKDLRQYKVQSSRMESSLTSCLNEVITVLTVQYERCHVQEWMQELSDKYQVFLDTCVPRARRMGSWHQMAVAGGVAISMVVVGTGIWCFR